MTVLAAMGHRERRPELMDEPGLDPRRHEAALAGLGRLNRASLATRSLWRAIERLAGSKPTAPLRVLDVASGGGDVARGLWRVARRRGCSVEVHGLDVSPTAVAHARRQSAADETLTFAEADVLSQPLPDGFDVITCSLFLHHLADADAETLLKEMARVARVGVVVSDLRRSVAGYALAGLACRVLSRSPIVHTDGPRSVRAAYTGDELGRIAETAGLSAAKVQRQWPERLLLSWRRVSEQASQ